MPYVDFNDPAAWAAMYDPPFERANKDRICGTDSWSPRNLRLALEAVGMNSTHRVALIGGGYGWVAEEWISAGYASVIVCDTSTYIQGNKGSHAVVEVYGEGGDTTTSKNNIKALLNRKNNEKIDWAVTEDVLPCLLDSEILNYAPHLRDLATNVAHWVTPLQPGNAMALNWKSVADWKTMLSPDYIVARGSSVAV